MNEAELFDAVAVMLKDQGRKEKLQYFRHSDFKGLTDVASCNWGPRQDDDWAARRRILQLPLRAVATSVIEIITDSNTFFVPCFWYKRACSARITHRTSKLQTIDTNCYDCTRQFCRHVSAFGAWL